MQAIQTCWTSFFFCRWTKLLIVAVVCGTGVRGVAQTAGSGVEVLVSPVVSSDEIAEVELPRLWSVAESLPDAPEPQKTEPQKTAGQTNDANKPLVTATTTVPANSNLPMAPMYSRVIPAGMATPQIHKWDKIELASRNLYSLSSIVSIVVSAGYSHVTNGQPNYGTDSGAFGQRVGAAAIRDSSQAFLSNGPLAVWLHQDPRYFALGNHYSLGKRLIYAISRPLITRSSSDGHPEFNSSLILGQAAGVALTNLYYPQSNRNFHDNIARFGGSMGGCALSFGLDEFTSDLLRAVRLRRLERLMH